MSKRAGPRPTHPQDQADLFGAAAPPLPRKKPRPLPRAHPPSGKPTPAPQPLPAAQNAVAGGLLNVRQAAARLGLSKSTLDKMRCAGKGPRFVKSTDRAVRYDPADLDAWIDARRRNSTSKA